MLIYGRQTSDHDWELPRCSWTREVCRCGREWGSLLMIERLALWVMQSLWLWSAPRDNGDDPRATSILRRSDQIGKRLALRTRSIAAWAIIPESITPWEATSRIVDTILSFSGRLRGRLKGVGQLRCPMPEICAARCSKCGAKGGNVDASEVGLVGFAWFPAKLALRH
jgi:hypothetical protein